MDRDTEVMLRELLEGFRKSRRAAAQASVRSQDEGGSEVSYQLGRESAYNMVIHQVQGILEDGVRV